MLNSGSLSFDGSVGQLFNITDSMSGTIYSVNDISGIPSIEVLDTGLVKIAQYNGNVVVGSGVDNAVDKVQVVGTTSIVANSSSAALRVTQTGTGDALRVEDSANPDSTPFRISTDGLVLVGGPPVIGGGSTYPVLQVTGYGDGSIGTNAVAIGINGFLPFGAGGYFAFNRSNSATVGTNAIVANGDQIGRIVWSGADGTNYIRAAQISAEVDGAPGTNDMPGRLVFSTTQDGTTSPTEALRINSSQNVGIGNGVTTTDSAFSVSKPITTGTGAYGIRNFTTVSSNTTGAYLAFSSHAYTAATSFTLGSYVHYEAQQLGFGAGSTVTNQFGFRVQSNLIGATNNYGFFSDIPSGTNRWNFFASGTADNYLGGPLKIGQTYYSNTALGIFWAPAAASVTGIYQDSTINSATTTSYVLNSTFPGTAAASFTLPTLIHYQAGQNTFGAGSTVTNQFGFRVLSSLIGATINYGFYSDIASGSGRWNFYANGTAPNYFAGSVSIGSGGGSEMLFVNQTADATTARFINSSSSGVYRPISVHSTANNIPGLSLSRWYSAFAGNADIGQIRFDGLGTGGGYVEHASIYALATGANTSTGAPTLLSFRTSNGTSCTEKMTISATGVVAVTSGITSTSTTTGSLVITGGVGIAGALNATTKSFIIDHPTKPGKLLKHGSLEGPEFGVYVRGRITGVDAIELPEYWTGLVDPATITVNLTPVGSHQNLYVYSIENNVVTVKNSNMLNKVIDCFYTVFAERCDVEKLQVEV
jgi:hypothetical protein